MNDISRHHLGIVRNIRENLGRLMLSDCNTIEEEEGITNGISE